MIKILALASVVAPAALPGCAATRPGTIGVQRSAGVGLERGKASLACPGCGFDAPFSGDGGACMVIEEIGLHAMRLAEAGLRTFTKKVPAQPGLRGPRLPRPETGAHGSRRRRADLKRRARGTPR